MRKGKKANRANFKLDSRLIKTALVFIFSLFLLSYLYKTAETFLSQSNTFLVNENCVKSNVVLDKNTKREISGKSLFSLDAGKIRRMLLEGNPLYQEVCVLKEFPATVKILIKKRRPLAQIKNSLFYLIDREGVILSGGSAEPFDNFVAIDLYDRARKLDPGDLIRDKRLEYAFILWEAFQGKDVVKRFVITSINATSLPALSFMIGSKDRPEETNAVKVIIGIDDVEHKLFIFDNLVNEKLKGNLAGVKYIDLRFKEGYIGVK